MSNEGARIVFTASFGDLVEHAKEAQRRLEEIDRENELRQAACAAEFRRMARAIGEPANDP